MLRHEIVFVARETGWALDYIGKLPVRLFLCLVNELHYLKSLDNYNQTAGMALIAAILTSDKSHHRTIEEFIGKEPQRSKEVQVLMTGDTDATVKAPVKVILGDGQEYVFGGFNVNIIELLEEEYDKNWDDLVDKMRAKVLKSLVFYLLRDNYPDITKEKIGELLTGEVLEKAYQAVSLTI